MKKTPPAHNQPDNSSNHNKHMTSLLDEYDLAVAEARFFEALKQKDRINSFLYLGQLQYLSSRCSYPEYRIRYAECLCLDEQYEMAIRALDEYVQPYYANLQNGGFPARVAQTMLLRLKIIALSGHILEFIHTVQKCPFLFAERDELKYYYLLAIRNANFDELREYRNYYTNENTKEIEVSIYDADNSSIHHKTYTQELCRCMSKAIQYLKEYCLFSDVNTETRHEAFDTRDYIDLFRYKEIILNAFSDTQESAKYISIFSNISKEKIEEIQGLYTSYIFNTLSSESNDFDNFQDITSYLVFFECLEMMDAMDVYCKFAQTTLSLLPPSFLTGGNKDIQHILRVAFYSSESFDVELSDTIKAYATSIVDENSYEYDSAISRKILNSLTARGIVAFKLAEEDFSNTTAVTHGWKDAGLLSLAYVRLLELELTQRLIIPLINKLDPYAIDTCYCAERERITDKRKRGAYEKKWGSIIRDLSNLTTGYKSNLELGNLFHLINAIRYDFGGSRKLATLLFNTLYDETNMEASILTAEGKVAFLNGDLENCISAEVRQKFRNPPAHTVYLPYSVAAECRSFVREKLLLFSEWFQ